MAFALDVIAAIRELGVPIMRWPGGNFVSDHHWYEAVGPERVPSYNKAWRVEEPNSLRHRRVHRMVPAGRRRAVYLHQWRQRHVRGNEQLGRILQRRARHALRPPAPRPTAATQPIAVRYWGIGNESYGDWQIGAKTVAEWGPYVAESAKMMRAVDESIVLSASAVPDADWTLTLLQTCRPLPRPRLDPRLLGHRCMASDNVSDYLTCMMHTDGPEDHRSARPGTSSRSAGFAGPDPHRLRRVEPARLASPGGNSRRGDRRARRATT